MNESPTPAESLARTFMTRAETTRGVRILDRDVAEAYFLAMASSRVGREQK